MKRVSLTKGIVKAIHAAIDKTYDRAIGRFLARPPVDKKIWLGVTKPRVNLPGLFQAASAEERTVADKNVLERLLDIAQSFVEAQRHATKAKVVKAVEDWLGQAHTLGAKKDLDVVLGGQLVDVWNQATTGMHKIVAAESNNAKNMGSLDGIVKVNSASGVEDPIVYFVVVHDDALCSECKRLHLMPDESTPRLWFLSEVKRGYHTKSDDVPSLAGEHPHCRCSLVTLMSDYGFDKNGSISFIESGHDEMKKQRG